MTCHYHKETIKDVHLTGKEKQEEYKTITVVYFNSVFLSLPPPPTSPPQKKKRNTPTHTCYKHSVMVKRLNLIYRTSIVHNFSNFTWKSFPFVFQSAYTILFQFFCDAKCSSQNMYGVQNL